MQAIQFEHTPPEPARFHEYANLFPMLLGEPLDSLRDDIQAHGVREPIVFLDGAILDGRNRYQCARDLGIEYPRVDYEGNDPLGFVISHNLHRRHLSESQRAMVASRLAKMERGRPTENTAIAAITQHDASALLNVSADSIQRARTVRDKGDESLVQSVERGAVSVSAAADVATLPKEEQAEIVAKGADAVRDAAKDVRAKRKPFVTANTGKVEWYTPPDILNRARRVLGAIDFDPASSEDANKNVEAAHFYSAEDDALACDWPSGRIWMNPPYSQSLMRPFCERFAKAMRDGSTGIALVNNATETGWFNELAGCASALCFLRGRLRYLNSKGEEEGTPLQGQAVVYSGSDHAAFKAAFSDVGFVVGPLP